MTLAAATPEPGDGDLALAPLLAMLATLPQAHLAELESALSRRLQPPPSAADRRVAELGFLAQLLHELRPLGEQPSPDATGPTQRPKISRGRRRGAEIDVPWLDRITYEQRQPLEAPDAPSAKLLVSRYRTWTRACRAAYGLRPDGRSLGPSNPWAQPQRGKPRAPRYTDDVVRDSIRRCAFVLGRIPSAGDYHFWAREQKRLPRHRGSTGYAGGHPPVPGIQVVYRLYKKAGSEGNRWRAAVADAQLDEADIARARYKQLRLDEESAVPTPDKVILLMPINEAIDHARVARASLDWLAGRAVEPGVPPADDAVFDPARVAVERRRRGIAEDDLRLALRLQLGPLRRLMNGKLEPTLGQVAIIGTALGVSIERLLT